MELNAGNKIDMLIFMLSGKSHEKYFWKKQAINIFIFIEHTSIHSIWAKKPFTVENLL